MAQSHTILAEIDLEGCPVGNVLNADEPKQDIEEKFFEDWRAPLAHPRRTPKSQFRVIPEGEHRVLEHIDTSDRCLISGNRFWENYSIEATMRQLAATTNYNYTDDQPHAHRATTGLLFRYQDLRRYYFFCMEGFERFVLYRRKDTSWTNLGEFKNGIDRSRCYHLKIEGRGSLIRCYINGSKVIEVTDTGFATGKAGIRTNTRSRFYSVRVVSKQPDIAASKTRMNEYEREVAREAEKYPEPVLGKRIDIRDYWPCSVSFIDFRNTDDPEIVLTKDRDEGVQISCLDFEGELQWQKLYPDAKELKHLVCHDLDADGFKDFIGVDGTRLRVVSGKTGDITAEAELPESSPYLGNRGESLAKYMPEGMPKIYPCKLRKTEKPQDLILRDADGGGTGYSIWAFDDTLNLRWRQDAHSSFYGMYIWFYDVDGDGREEILPGYDLYDGDGNHLWSMEGSEYIENHGGLGHVDHAVFGELDGDESNGPEIGMAASDPGFFLVDARTGEVLRHHPYGHVQGIQGGNFCPERDGLEMWMGNRWGNYGILNLVDGRGEPITRLEPDNISQGGASVNWTGDGQELLFLSSTREAFGFYDSQGRKVLLPNCPELPFYWSGGQVKDVIGDPRDEVIYVHKGIIYIVTQKGSYPKGEKIYAPIRRRDISIPNWKVLS